MRDHADAHLATEKSYLEEISVSGFRNLAKQKISLSEATNVLLGKNGQGKTNFLEAVFFLSNLRPMRNVRLNDMVTHGAERASIRGRLKHLDLVTEMGVELAGCEKKYFLDGKQAHGVREYIGLFKSIAFTPDDMNLIRGTPENRRRFADRAAFLMNPDHLRLLYGFRLALRSRNRLLKEGDLAQLDGFGERLAWYGHRVSENRKRAMEQIGSILDQNGGKKAVRYRMGWSEEGGGGSAALLLQLQKSAALDRQLGRTSIGPQRDDFDILVDGRPASRFASQGEQRSCSIEIMLAVVEVLKGRGHTPLVLLDDISSELDETNRMAVMERMSTLGTQVLLTATDGSNVLPLVKGERKVFLVENGRLEESRCF